MASIAARETGMTSFLNDIDDLEDPAYFVGPYFFRRGPVRARCLDHLPVRSNGIASSAVVLLHYLCTCLNLSREQPPWVNRCQSNQVFAPPRTTGCKEIGR